MHQPEPKTFKYPTTGDIFTYERDTVLSPSSGTVNGPTREAVHVPSDVDGARIFATVVAGMAGVEAEISDDGSSWVDGVTGIVPGTPGVAESVFFRAVVPTLATEENGIAEIVIHQEHTEDSDWRA